MTGDQLQIHSVVSRMIFNERSVVISLVTGLMRDNQFVFRISELTHQLDCVFNAFSLDYPGWLQNEDITFL